MIALATALLLQTAAATPEPVAALQVGWPRPELVGMTTEALETTLRSRGLVITGFEATSRCSLRCDEIRAAGTPSTEGGVALVDLRKGRVTRARWIVPGDPARPRSFPKLTKVFPRRRVPEEMFWLGGSEVRDGVRAPDGWYWGWIAWPKWGRLTQVVALVPKKKDAPPRKIRVVELLETDGRVVDSAMPAVPKLAGSTPSDLLRLYGEPVHVLTQDRETPIADCASLASCDGTWVYEPTCHRPQQMVCRVLTVQVANGRVIAARWSFDNEYAALRLPPPAALSLAVPSEGLTEEPSSETYPLPDGSTEPFARRLQWRSEDVEWTVDVVCPAVPHGLGVRKPRADEWRVYSVFQRPAP